MSEQRERSPTNPVVPAEDLTVKLGRARHAPPTLDDRAVLAGAHGQPATADELRAFVAREQARIAQATKR